MADGPHDHAWPALRALDCVDDAVTADACDPQSTQPALQRLADGFRVDAKRVDGVRNVLGKTGRKLIEVLDR